MFGTNKLQQVYDNKELILDIALRELIVKQHLSPFYFAAHQIIHCMFHLKALLVVRQIAAVKPAIGVISGQQDVGHHFNSSAVILMVYAWYLCKHHSGPHKIGYHNHYCIHKAINRTVSDICPTKGGITDDDRGWRLGGCSFVGMTTEPISDVQ